MGCTFSSEEPKDNAIKPKKVESSSRVGQISFKIHNFSLRQVEEKIEKLSNLFLKIRFSNQEQYFSFSQLNTQNNPTIKFPINSLSRPYGRFLLIQLWSNVVRDFKDAGFGMVILDPIINKSEKQIVRCDLNYKNSPAGYLDIQIMFEEYEYQDISIKLYSLLLRTEQKVKSDIVAKVIIGEEMVEAPIITQEDTQIVGFPNAIHHFRIPTFLNKGEIKIVDKKGNADIFRGRIQLNLKQMLQTDEQFDGYQSLNEDGSINGRIRYCSLKGVKKQYHFQQPKPNLRSQNRLVSLRAVDDCLTQSQQITKSTRDNGTEPQILSSSNNMGLEIEKIKNKMKLKKKMSCQYN